MPSFPQTGGCLCGDIRFTLHEDPVTVYACHCTDCQKETGSAFYLAVVMRSEALEYTTGQPEDWQIELVDGRTKGSYYCPRCKSKVGGAPRDSAIASVDGGCLDDTSWLSPTGHIWTRSAQPWIELPEASVQTAKQPTDEDYLAMVRAWKARDA